jgi:hypothetical protein
MHCALDHTELKRSIFLDILLLAARLSEDPHVRVAVVEAGADYDLLPTNKPLVDIPGADTLGCGSNQCKRELNILNPSAVRRGSSLQHSFSDKLMTLGH